MSLFHATLAPFSDRQKRRWPYPADKGVQLFIPPSEALDASDQDGARCIKNGDITNLTLPHFT